MGRREGKRQLGRPSRRWEDNIKMDLQGLRWVIYWTGIPSIPTVGPTLSLLVAASPRVKPPRPNSNC